MLRFGSCRIDVENQQLWRDDELLRLTAKSFDVLSYLVQRPGALVTKDDLFDAVWADTVVSDSALTSCIKEIRKALDDDAKKPTYVETVHRRGYRFVASIEPEAAEARAPEATTAPTVPHLVGRTEELERLGSELEQAAQGMRRLVFVHGEPGIGKTALVDTFLDRARRDGPLARIARGQCVDSFGVGEAYFPLLEALGRACRDTEGETVVSLLRQHAPTWLAQLPGLLPADEWRELQHQVRAVTRERMLREFAVALEEISSKTPLVLVLEDLHWSDPSTVELLGSVARRPEAARLLIVATFRPVETQAAEHSLRRLLQELAAHGQCESIDLPALDSGSIEAYLHARFPGTRPPELSRVLHERTGGNPLFLVNTIEALRSAGALVESSDGWAFNVTMADVTSIVPESLRGLIQRQAERLDESQRNVLRSAAIAGSEFPTASLAAALEEDVVHIEEICDRLATRVEFLERAGLADWPDGTRAARYRFRHAFYVDFWFDEVTVSQRARWQRRIAERVEQAYAGETSEVAAELALRFEQCGDSARAIGYLREAGESALQRNAYTEAIAHLSHGLEIVPRLPDEHESADSEMRLQLLLAPALLLRRGHAEPGVQTAYQRLHELCRETADTTGELIALVGLQWFYLFRADYEVIDQLIRETYDFAERTGSQGAFTWGRMSEGIASSLRGDFPGGKRNLEEGALLFQQHGHEISSLLPLGMGAHSLRMMGVEPLGFGWMVFTLFHLGYLDQAERMMSAAVELSRGRSHPFGIAGALGQAAHFHIVVGKPEMAAPLFEDAMRLSVEHGFQDFIVMLEFYGGWLQAAGGEFDQGLARMQGSLQLQRAAGVRQLEAGRWALIAELCLILRRAAEGREAIAEAQSHMDEFGERHYEAEVDRLRGELLLLEGRSGAEEEAEACFQRALTVSERQHAKTLELRAAASVVRLRERAGDAAAAKARLEEVYGWFTEGFDTPDLRSVRTLLDRLP